MRNVIAIVVFVAAGCSASETELRLIIEDPAESEPTVITLEHAVAVSFAPIEHSGGVLAGGTFIYAAQSPDICTTLSMGFVRAQEYFAFIQLPDAHPDTQATAIWGPDDQCEAWAEVSAPRDAEVVDDELLLGFDGVELQPDPSHPWRNARVFVEGVVAATTCPEEIDVGGLRCGVPTGTQQPEA